MVKVKNQNSLSDHTCNCGSWLKHWEKYSGMKAVQCAAKGNMHIGDLVGAHVKKDPDELNCYIIPLCKLHAMQAGEFEVSGSTVFVSAKKNETCG